MALDDGVGCCASSSSVKSCCNGDGVRPTIQNDCYSSRTSGPFGCTTTKFAEDEVPCCNVTIRLSTSSNTKTSCCSDDVRGGGCAAVTCCIPPPTTTTAITTKTLTCIAIIRQQNSTVDIFDIHGQSRTFSIGGRRNNDKRILSSSALYSSEQQRKLCFATHHGTEKQQQMMMIDGILTPCFNGEGQHDEADEGCPCGVDEPHIHAHYHDPKICDMDYNSNNNKDDTVTTGWSFLSQLTLPLVNNNGDNNNMSREKETKNGVVTFPLTDSMPNECNSIAINNHLLEQGLKRTCKGDSRCTNRQIYPVTHDDHTDYLIHNETLGVLHMEHPCILCGQYDIHGRFRRTHTRSWTTTTSAKDNNTTRINLHFFEEYKEPFRLFDVLSGLFEVESTRVHAASCKIGGGVPKLPSSSSTTKVVIDSLPTSSSVSSSVSTTTTTRVGRSQFHIQEICCASEIPQIESILRPIVGIELLSINPTVKMVYVDHNVDILSADAIAKALKMQGFGAVVKVNASTLLDQLGGIPTDVFVLSSFDMTDIYNNTTEGDTDKISEVIQTCLDMPLIEKQVKNIIVNEKEMILSVEHNPYYLTAHGIVEMLNNYMYDVKIISDGGADGLWALTVNDTTKGTSKQHDFSTTVRITVYIGGSWDYLKYVALLSVAFGLPHVAMKAFRTLRRCHFDVNCMMFLAASGALALQDYPESAAVVFLFSIGEVLEQRATSRARDALSEIVSTRPEYANVINPITHDIVVLPVNSVVVGTTVSVRTGDKIPCDGEIIEGMSTVDESSLTGESRPITKSAGMKVTGGSINSGNTQLVIRTTATSNDSAVAKLIRLLEEAQSNRSETEMVRRIPCSSFYMLFL